jgi:hypothetical protein
MEPDVEPIFDDLNHMRVTAWTDARLRVDKVLDRRQQHKAVLNKQNPL